MKRNLILILGIFLAILFTLLAGNLITIGEKLAAVTHLWFVEYIFYLIILVLCIWFIIIPIWRVHHAPEMPALTCEDDDRNAEQLYAFGLRLVDNCHHIQNKDVRLEYQAKLKASLDDYRVDAASLRSVIRNEIEVRVKGNKDENIMGLNSRIKEWAKTVFMVTAISQNSRFDTIAVMVLNYKMIEDIILSTGFRPTRPQMFKQYSRILLTSLVTYAASEMFNDMDGWAPFDAFDVDSATDAVASAADGSDAGFDISQVIKRFKIPGVVLGSALDGVVNALMTLRIGFVTRNYLIQGANSLDTMQKRRKAKREAIKDAFKTIPSVVASESAVLGTTVTKLILKMFRAKPTDE